MTKFLKIVAVLSLGIFTAPLYAAAEEKSIILQSTTSTENSGLLNHLIPIFKKDTGIRIHVVAVGTGQALKNAQNGDGDVLLVHAKSAEETFVKKGYGVERFDVMFNDFVILGPKNDPAKVKGLKDVTLGLAKISNKKASFISRGDDSGTHKKELNLWKNAGIALNKDQTWYRESGSGMGATLNIAAGMGAYVMSDRATWIAFKNKANLEILIEGDKRLFNQYGVILVNPAKHKNVKAKLGQTFIDWLTGAKGQAAIKTFKVNGKQLFFPNAKPADMKKAS
ncbi:MAG: tungsten ABC transporter substrate-binding protein [Methyloligella sp.]|nr:MAG: tungsten ABC transporter substrate-binding protein [Methyloligella sp.]